MTRQEARERAEEIEPQEQDRRPGVEREMQPPAEFIRDDYRGSDKLDGKVAIVTGGDSGIGRAAAVHFAREGADVAVVYLEEDEDARRTTELIEEEGRAPWRSRATSATARSVRPPSRRSSRSSAG